MHKFKLIICLMLFFAMIFPEPQAQSFELDAETMVAVGGVVMLMCAFHYWIHHGAVWVERWVQPIEMVPLALAIAPAVAPQVVHVLKPVVGYSGRKLRDMAKLPYR